MSRPEPERLPRSDIPPDYTCIYPACGFKAPADSKRRELSFRNHMATCHGVYYEKAPPSAVATKLAAFERYNTNLDNMQEIAELSSWHCAALAKAEITGLPIADVAREGKHSPETLRRVAKSPAAVKYIAEIRSNLHDPVLTVKNLLAAGMVNKLLDWEQAWQLAVQAKDYEAIHKMAKDIGLQPALEQKQAVGPTKISLHLNMNDLGTPNIKSTFTVVDDPEYLLQDPADDPQTQD